MYIYLKNICRITWDIYRKAFTNAIFAVLLTTKTFSHPLSWWFSLMDKYLNP